MKTQCRLALRLALCLLVILMRPVAIAQTSVPNKSDAVSSIPTEPVASTMFSVAFDDAEAQGLRAALFFPFVQAGEVSVSEALYRTDQERLPAHIPNWSLVAVDTRTLKSECKAGGQLMALDWSAFPHREQLLPAAVETCGIGYAVAGTALAYAVAHKYGTPPLGWRALWDFERFPGKRAFPKRARDVLEIALLADGVSAQQLYQVLATPAGYQRALQKIADIEEHIIWWDNALSLPGWLMSGEVALAVGPDGALQVGDGWDNIAIVRDQVLYDLHYFAIPASAPQPHLAYALASFATQRTQQINLAQNMPYGTVLKQGWNEVSEETFPRLTNNPLNMKGAILKNTDFWLKQGATIEQDFEAWVRRNDPTTVTTAVARSQAQPTFVGPPQPAHFEPPNIKPEPPKPEKPIKPIAKPSRAMTPPKASVKPAAQPAIDPPVIPPVPKALPPPPPLTTQSPATKATNGTKPTMLPEQDLKQND